MDKTCGTCGKAVDMTFYGDCRDCQIDSYDEDANDCHNCGGEGFTYGCGWDWQCDTWDGDSCLCTRRCEWCQPPTAAEQAERQKLRDIMATALSEHTPKEPPHAG